MISGIMDKGYQPDKPLAKNLNQGVQFAEVGRSYFCFLLIPLIFTPFRPLWSHFVLLLMSFVDNFTHTISENYQNI